VQVKKKKKKQGQKKKNININVEALNKFPSNGYLALFESSDFLECAFG
jgi:hypothetical protein